MWCFWVFILGLMVGSFLNVLIARLPHEKSIVWPSSRCFACFQPIRFTDNIPIWGYLRLRGKCRGCGVSFSARYLWVEIGTGLGFLALFVAEVLFNWQNVAAMNFDPLNSMNALPPWQCLVVFAYHAFLLVCLIAAAAIDAEHRIIPSSIPYTGVFVGVLGGALMPWPWPNPDTIAAVMPQDQPWMLEELWGKIPPGAQLWPFYGPTFAFAPPGSFQLGLLNGLLGAFAGSLVVRIIKWLFEVGFGREALGLGDADLLMLAGAFLGWQIAVLSLFVGAFAAIFLKIIGAILGSPDAPTVPSSPVAVNPANSANAADAPMDSHELPFGPGLALGVGVTWFAWPWIGPFVQYVFFDAITFGVFVFILCVGMLAAGLLLRKPEVVPTNTTPAKV